MVPTINGNRDLVEGDKIVLSCRAVSTSQPEEYQHLAVMMYTWSDGTCVTSDCNQTSIGPVSRQHHNKEISCTAIEQGANGDLSSYADIVLVVKCK